MTDLYKQDGVDLALGDAFSRFAGDVCKASWHNSPYIKINDLAAHNFRGPRFFEFVNLPPGMQYDIGVDGIGTKVGIISEAFSHRQAAQDLFAMCCSDISRWGSLPVLFTNILDVSTLGERGGETQRLFREAMSGLGEVARQSNVVLFRGETAELGPYVGSENPDAVTKFNWAGFAVGIRHPHRVITGEEIQPKDVVIALREHGFRSNGLSMVRKALAMRYGDRWWENPDAQSAIKAASTHATLYDRFLAIVNGWTLPGFHQLIHIKSIVHISGGGIPGKFAKDILFPLGLSAELEDLWEPSEIMRQCVEWRGVEDRGAYDVLHGGQGMLVVVGRDNEQELLAQAEAQGIEAKSCGTIMRTYDPKLIIYSKFKPGAITWGPKDV